MAYEAIVLLISGLGAGLLTGLLGASAVMFVVPIMILFLSISTYDAIGLSLAIDIFTSLTTSIIFYKNQNIKLKRSILLVLVSILFVILGSYISKFIPQNNLTGAMGFGIFIVGFLTYMKKERKMNKIHEVKIIYVILAGMVIGLISGIFGAGGGILILFTLVFLLRYNMHEAIGTSAFIMIVIAICGATTHYYYSPFKISYVIIASIGGIIGAYFSSIMANRLNERKLTKIAGIILSSLGLAMFLKSIL
jgi:uncharacterized protein